MIPSTLLRLPIVACLALLPWPSSAWAAQANEVSSASLATTPEEAPYAPYRGEGIAGPAATSSAPYPAPLPEEPEFTRRSVELVLDLGLGLPHCAAGDDSDARCSGVGGGLSLGLTALWRVTPMFAWGGTLEVAGFRNEPDDPELTDARAGAVFLGLTGRVYFNEEGRFEPFIELGLGEERWARARTSRLQTVGRATRRPGLARRSARGSAWISTCLAACDSDQRSA